MPPEPFPRLDPKTKEDLRALMEPGDDDLFAELAVMFLESSEEALTELVVAVQNGDSDQVVEVAHKWKSSSAGLGAKQLSELCRQLEAAGHERSDTPTLKKLLIQITEEYRAVAVELAREVK